MTVMVIMLGSSSKLAALIGGKSFSSKPETVVWRVAVLSVLLVLVDIAPIMRYGACVCNR